MTPGFNSKNEKENSWWECAPAVIRVALLHVQRSSQSFVFK